MLHSGDSMNFDLGKALQNSNCRQAYDYKSLAKLSLKCMGILDKKQCSVRDALYSFANSHMHKYAYPFIASTLAPPITENQTKKLFKNKLKYLCIIYFSG